MNILSEATTLQIRKDRLSQKAESSRKLRIKHKTERESLLQTAKFYTELKNIILSISSDFSKIIQAVENDESSTISTIEHNDKLHNFNTNQGIFT